MRLTLTAACVLVGSIVCCGMSSRADDIPRIAATDRQAQRWNFFLTENEIDRLWLDLSARHVPESFAVTHVTVLAMTATTGDAVVLENHTVLVRDGTIRAVHPSGRAAVPTDVVTIDGRGKFLLPGLIDMHVHSLVSNSQPLLNLANGVTSVRDMSGFDWMLRLRRRIADNELLAPNMYVAGHILSSFPMDMYATVVGSPAAARGTVRDQVMAGYDFIKVHNGMPADTYAAVLDEARRHDIDVVGHVPQGILVAEAIARGQRTLEHFKGYLLDNTLTLTDEDFVAATRGADVWNCPTFYNYRSQRRGPAARDFVLEGADMRYAAPSERRDWLAVADEPETRLVQLRQGILEHSKTIFRKLLAIDARFVAGTDSGGGQAFMVPGFALHEEMRIMHDTGLSTTDTLRAATIQAARAMGVADAVGSIAVGKRADLLLLDENPLESIAHLASVAGVAVRGIWLTRKSLDDLLESVATIYTVDSFDDLLEPPTVADIDGLIERMRSMRAEGFLYRDFDIEEITRLMLACGLDDDERAVRNLKSR